MVTPRVRISYPAQAVFTERFTVTLTLRNLKEQHPRRVYEWFDLMENIAPGNWEMENTRAAGPARSVTLNVSPSEDMDARKFQFQLDRRHGRTVKSPTFRVDMIAPATPQGSPDDWSSLSGTNPDGSVVRWNPCQPIRWVFNPNGTEAVYPDALADVTEALARVSAGTGLTFTYAGLTTTVPYADNTARPTAEADLFIGFASSAQVSGFTEAVVGLGGPLGYTQALDGTLWIEQGAAMMRTDTGLGTGFTDGGEPTYGQTMVHEVLHAVGLGHAQGDEQIMSAYLGRTNHRFGAGDLTGMAVHGATHGCPPSPIV